jgi:hypothetical protein
VLDVTTGNVDQDVYLPKLASSATYCLFNRRRVGHVHVNRKVGTLTELHKLSHHVMCSALVKVQNRDPRAFGRESNGAGASYAMCSASHQRCRTVEAPTQSENHSSRFARHPPWCAGGPGITRSVKATALQVVVTARLRHS